MIHYVAIVEEEEGKAIGVWFADLPGCISAGAMIESGQIIPPARSLTDLKADPEIAQDLARDMVALIPFPQGLHQHAAE